LFSSSPCCLFFMNFTLCPEQNIYLNIDLLKSLWNYLSNVWSFIKNGVQTRVLCPFYFSTTCCPKLISGRVALGDSGITSCRNLRLSWFLIGWNHNFMGLLNIKKIQCFPFETTHNFDETSGFLRIDPVMLMILVILSSRASCCTSVWKIQGLCHTRFSKQTKCYLYVCQDLVSYI
jgi:hypothetical protein